MAREKTWLRHEIQVEGKNDEKTRSWLANGEPTPGLYLHQKGSVDDHDARGLYAAASLSGGQDETASKNRNLSPAQF